MTQRNGDFSYADGVSLQDHLETIISLHKEAAAQALELATTELHRRLGDLNGETGKIKTILDSTLPRELAEQRFGQLEKSIRDLELDRAKLLGKASQNSFLVTLAVSAVGLLLSSCSLIASVGFTIWNIAIKK